MAPASATAHDLHSSTPPPQRPSPTPPLPPPRAAADTTRHRKPGKTATTAPIAIPKNPVRKSLGNHALAVFSSPSSFKGRDVVQLSPGFGGVLVTPTTPKRLLPPMSPCVLPGEGARSAVGNGGGCRKVLHSPRSSWKLSPPPGQEKVLHSPRGFSKVSPPAWWGTDAQVGARQGDSERGEGLNPFATGGGGVWSRSPLVGSCTDSGLGDGVGGDDGCAQETAAVVQPRRDGDVEAKPVPFPGAVVVEEITGAGRGGRVEGLGAGGKARENIEGGDAAESGDGGAMSAAVDALQKTAKARKGKKSSRRREHVAPIFPKPSPNVPPLHLDSDTADTADTITDTSSDVNTNIDSGHASSSRSSSSSISSNGEATNGIPEPTVPHAALQPAVGTKSTSSFNELQDLHPAGPPGYGSTANTGGRNAYFYTSRQHTNYGSIDNIDSGSSSCWESRSIVGKDLENGTVGIGHVEGKTGEDDDGSPTGSDRFGTGGLGHALRMILRSRATLLLYAATSVRMVATWTLASYLAVSKIKLVLYAWSCSTDATRRAHFVVFFRVRGTFPAVGFHSGFTHRDNGHRSFSMHRTAQIVSISTPLVLRRTCVDEIQHTERKAYTHDVPYTTRSCAC